jgi:hypothetical protein
MNYNNDVVEAVERLKSVAELVFQDYKSNGFSGDLAIAYNVLVSAFYYLESGKTMVGGRCASFFAGASCL